MAKDDVADRRPDLKARRARPEAPTEPDPLAAWRAPARGLKGVGAHLDGVLARLFGLPQGVGARRLDLLWHLPYAVIERQLHASLAGASEGERVTLEVVVERHQPAPQSRFRPRAALRQPYRVRCQAAAGRLHLVFFRARRAYLEAALPEGSTRIVSGPLTRFGRDWQIVHPELILTPAEFEGAGPLQPVYPLTRGLSARVMSRLARQALEDLPELPEWQDRAFLERRRWPSFREALRSLHQPASADEVALDGAGAPAPRLRRAARPSAGPRPGPPERRRPARAGARRRRPALPRRCWAPCPSA